MGAGKFCWQVETQALDAVDATPSPAAVKPAEETPPKVMLSFPMMLEFT